MAFKNEQRKFLSQIAQYLLNMKALRFPCYFALPGPQVQYRPRYATV